MTNTASDLLESKLISEYRAEHPESRAPGVIKLVRNGSSTKQYGCTLCGAVGPTFCARWRETKASREWARAHRADHLHEAHILHLANNGRL